MCRKVSHGVRGSGVGVVRVSGEYRLLSVASFRPGEFLFEIEGDITRTPTRHSLQIDQYTHIDLVDYHDLEQILDHYYWRFMNHSCDPNVFVRGRNVIALRSIRQWDEITFDYNTTEFEMAEPFECGCKSTDCRKTIRGFKHLAGLEQVKLRPWLAPHLLCLLDNETADGHADTGTEGSKLS